ncbi:unnamed protein product, partial [Brassica rapa subsp. trilocularis]
IEDSLLQLSTVTASNAFFRHLATPPDSSAHLRSIPKHHLPQIRSTISGIFALEEIPRHQSKSIKAFHHTIYLHDLLQQGRLEVSHVRFCKLESTPPIIKHSLPHLKSVAAPFLDCVCGVLRRNRRKPWQELIVLDIKGRVRVWCDYHGDVPSWKPSASSPSSQGLEIS